MSTNSIDASHLIAFVERLEHVDEEIKGLQEGRKEILAEAKGTGYDVKVIQKIVAIRKMDPDKRREEEEILELYLQAMGMPA